MQTQMRTVNWLDLSGEQQALLLARPAMADSAGLKKTVSEIISEMQRGDKFS